jgi:hypothetical protein
MRSLHNASALLSTASYQQQKVAQAIDFTALARGRVEGQSIGDPRPQTPQDQ